MIRKKEVLASTSVFKGRKGVDALGGIIVILLSIVSIAFLVYFSTNVKDLSSQMKEDGHMEGEVGEAVDSYNQNSSNFWDWSFAAVVLAIWIGSLWFIASRGDRSLQWTFIMLLVMILVMMAASYESRVWSDTIGSDSSKVSEYPITNFFFENFVALLGVMMFSQLMVGLYTNRGETGI